MMTAVTIGNKIAAGRKLQNMTQADLARQLAVSAQAVGKWERGESIPDVLMLQCIAGLFGTDLNYFAAIDPAAALLPVMTAYEEAQPQKQLRDGWDMSGQNWMDADFSGLHHLADKFGGANVQRCLFVGAELSGLILKGNNILNCDFSHADLSGCHIVGTNLYGNTFSECGFAGAMVSASTMKHCDFTGADFTGATIKFSHLRALTLSDVTFQGTRFCMNQFTDLTFSGEVTDCRFEGGDFTRVVFDGVIFRNVFVKNCKLKHARFCGCHADRLSLAFLKASKADVSGIVMAEE